MHQRSSARPRKIGGRSAGDERGTGERPKSDHDLRAEEWWHLRCRVPNVRWRDACDLDSSHRVRGGSAFPRANALWAIRAGCRPAVVDDENSSSVNRGRAGWKATRIQTSDHLLI